MKTELLLDTHVWVWLVTGEPKLIKTEFFTLLEKAEDIRLHLSAISLWEISMLVSKERLKLSMNTLDWLKIYLIFILLYLFKLRFCLIKNAFIDFSFYFSL